MQAVQGSLVISKKDLKKDEDDDVDYPRYVMLITRQHFLTRDEI